MDGLTSDETDCVHLLYIVAEGMYVYANDRYSDAEIEDKYSITIEGKAEIQNHIQFNVITANDIIRIGYGSHIGGDILE